MYSEADLEAAVAAGVMTPEAAAALRTHAGAVRAGPQVDEENIRLVTSFNDIFVTIASILLLVAMAWIGASVTMSGGAIACAATSWLLAEYFTRKRHMALPSIVLLIVFVWSIFFAATALTMGVNSVWTLDYGVSSQRVALNVALSAAIAAGAAYAHWRRFYVPITIAAGTAALVGLLLMLMVAAVPGATKIILLLGLVAGLGVFAFAMWWDISDRERITRRSDVAFWLHLFAAPMIVHPIFWLLGLLEGQATAARTLAVVLLYALFGIVALAVDRRALLVSALFYVLYALSALFRQYGAIQLNFAFTAAIIGSALLLLSAFWHPARTHIVGMLPAGWRARLPALNR